MSQSTLTYVAIALGVVALGVAIVSLVRQKGQMPPLRSVLIYLVLALVILAAAVWVLEASGLIKTNLSSSLAAAFTALGAILALIQLIPSINGQSLPTPPKSQEEQVVPPDPQSSVVPDDQAYLEQVRSIEGLLSRDPGKGALVVRVGKDTDMRVREVYIGGQKTYVSGHLASNGYTVYYATLRKLRPNNYTVHMDGHDDTKVPVNPDRVSELDWR